MEWKDIIAALSVVLNGLPQGLLALSLGFASVPTALAFLIGATGNAITGSVAVVSYQVETIALAGTLGKTMRDRLSMIFVGGAIMATIGLFGFLEKIVSFIGPVITSGMMAGVGIMLTRVSWDMARNNMPVGIVSMSTGLLTYFVTRDLVYTVTISVLISSLISLPLPKIGRYIPSESISGFLFVLGAIVTVPTNAISALTGGEASSSLVGGVTMVVTSISDPFFGMLAGLLMRVLISLFGM